MKLAFYGTNKKTEVLDYTGYCTFKTRSKMMRKFQSRNTSNWNIEEDIKIWEEDFITMLPPTGRLRMTYPLRSWKMQRRPRTKDKGRSLPPLRT